MISLKEAAQKLQKSLDELVNSVSREPEKTGKLSIGMAKNLVEVMENVKDYNQDLKLLEAVENIKSSYNDLEKSKSPKDSFPHVKVITQNCTEVLKTMKGFSTQEKDEEAKKEINRISMSTTPAVQNFIGVAKSATGKGEQGAKEIFQSAEKVVSSIEQLVQASPKACNLIKMLDNSNILLKDGQNLLSNVSKILKKPNGKKNKKNEKEKK